MNELRRRSNPARLLQLNKIVSFQVKPIKLFIFCSSRVSSRDLMIAESRLQSELIPSTDAMQPIDGETEKTKRLKKMNERNNRR